MACNNTNTHVVPANMHTHTLLHKYTINRLIMKTNVTVFNMNISFTHIEKTEKP